MYFFGVIFLPTPVSAISGNHTKSKLKKLIIQTAYSVYNTIR